MPAATLNPPKISPPRARPSSASGWFIFPAILAAAFLAYLPALQGGFVWDDNGHVTKAALRSFHGLWRIWTDLGATQQYYPLLHTAFWIEHRFWDDSVAGYHLVNLLQHAIAASLVVLIVRKLAIPGAWLAGLIFALHPVAVESVAWISEQKTTLSAIFYLSAFLVYLQYDDARDRKHYLWASGLFLCALLSKTVTATLPAALLVVFWWKRGRLHPRRDVRPLLPWLAAGAAAGLFTAWVERTYIHATGAEFAIPLADRLLVAGRVPWFYASKVLLPFNLIFTYPRWTIDAGQWWQWLFPLALLAAFAAAAKRRAALASLLFFVGTLFPVLGFLNVYPFRFSWVADHFQYLAMLGLIVPIAALVDRLRPNISRPATAAILITLAVLTFRQSTMFADTETLYRTTIARNPQSWMAHNNLGVVLAHAGRTAEAVAEYQAALRIKPDYPEPHNNLANIYSAQPNRLPDAIAEAKQAIQIKPDFADAHLNLAGLLARAGDFPEAIAENETSLQISPDLAEAHNNLGLELADLPGQLPSGVAELEAAVRLEPDNAHFRDNLAGALIHVPGRVPEAIAQVEASLEIEPNDPQAHDFLGRALSQLPGRLPDAIGEFQTALRIAPNFAQAHNDLGVVLLYVPSRRSEAIAEFRAALSIDPNNEIAQRNLQRATAQP